MKFPEKKPLRVRSNLADIRAHNVTDLLRNCVLYNL